MDSQTIFIIVAKASAFFPRSFCCGGVVGALVQKRPDILSFFIVLIYPGGIIPDTRERNTLAANNQNKPKGVSNHEK